MLMKEVDFKEIANGRIISRFKQVAILAGVILVGILISMAIQA